jgi:hypothetical protein
MRKLTGGVILIRAATYKTRFVTIVYKVVVHLAQDADNMSSIGGGLVMPGEKRMVRPPATTVSAAPSGL